MTMVDQIAAKGQEALRAAIISKMTGASKEQALLKEHYDSLQDLTNISKKTLKRFLRDKAQIGPQTRNLLAAIALGKQNDLLQASSTSQDYYLAFLKTLDMDPGQSESVEEPSGSIWQFGESLAHHYSSFTEVDKFVPLQCKRKRTGVKPEFTRELLQEIELNPELLSHHYRVLITGGPGMGKTLFAKYLCYHWTNHRNPDSDIPVYIDLKSPDFNRHAHGISSFLLTKYFRKELDWMVLDFLERNTESYYLLLDGFDDLEAKEKKALMMSMDAYSPNIRYIILGRPYAFQDFVYPSRSLYEICGLDLHAQRRLVEQFKPAISGEIQLSSLMAYIHGQPVLSQLARSPMHLTQMLDLATSSQSLRALEQIDSSLALQQAHNQHANR